MGSTPKFPTILGIVILSGRSGEEEVLVIEKPPRVKRGSGCQEKMCLDIVEGFINFNEYLYTVHVI